MGQKPWRRSDAGQKQDYTKLLAHYSCAVLSLLANRYPLEGGRIVDMKLNRTRVQNVTGPRKRPLSKHNPSRLGWTAIYTNLDFHGKELA